MALELRVVRANGTMETITVATLADVPAVIGCDVLDIVNLGGGRVMAVDDNGHRTNKPINAFATGAYQATHPGTAWTIVGDVAIMLDGED